MKIITYYKLIRPHIFTNTMVCLNIFIYIYCETVSKNLHRWLSIITRIRKYRKSYFGPVGIRTTDSWTHSRTLYCHHSDYLLKQYTLCFLQALKLWSNAVICIPSQKACNYCPTPWYTIMRQNRYILYDRVIISHTNNHQL